MAKDRQDGRAARAEMEEARSESKYSQSGLPRRYKLYDRISNHVSLRTVDMIIIITALLIVVLLFYGIATGGGR